MNQLKTTAIKQEKLLYAVLKSNKAEVEDVIKNKGQYYYSFTKIKKDKRGNVVYSNGKPKTREINATKGILKKFQSIIASQILGKIEMPKNIKGGVKGYNNIANARAHLGKKHKLKTDMKNYFPSIKYDLVFKTLVQNGFSSKVASIITHLTTNNYELPQGTPSSSVIANLVFIPCDNKIISYCDMNSITYTRYVDDLVFSSPADFKDKAADIIQFVIDFGFAVSVRKTIYTSGPLEITGVLTRQNVLTATNEYKELIADDTINPKTTKARIQYIKQFKR